MLHFHFHATFFPFVGPNLHRSYYFPPYFVFKPLSIIQIYSGLLVCFSGSQRAASKPPLPPSLMSPSSVQGQL